jgi:hypothetical protein
MPAIPGAHWKPSGGNEPVGRILLLLTVSLGVPYLAVAATGPLLQRWFTLTRPGVPPYRLYALSNAGSLLALLGYPFLLEPVFSRMVLGWAWSGCFAVFVLSCGACAWQLRHLPDRPARPAATPDAAPTLTDRLMWLALPATAALLLMATTNKVCLDLAAVPFLWVLPLGLYLLTFVLCFEHPRWYVRSLYIPLLVVGCAASAHYLAVRSAPLPQQVGVYMLTLFAACMVCHGELYRLRPAPSRLTAFYLTVAGGGALGGLFVALLAPLLFNDYREMEVGLVLVVYLIGLLCLLYRSRETAMATAFGVIAAILIVPALRTFSAARPDGTWLSIGVINYKTWLGEHALALGVGLPLGLVALWPARGHPDGWRPRNCVVPVLLALVLAVGFIQQAQKEARSVLAASRNFYGSLKLKTLYADVPLSRCYLLSHGGITHGLQFALSPQSNWPTTYYGNTSGVGRALGLLPGARRIGLVGLGAGTLAAYGRPGDTLRFYEIDPAVVGMAREQFIFLQSTPAKVEIVTGDARLLLEAELLQARPPQFDLLVLDAFSGDAIPVHLLTREAMAIYLGHLRPGGLIAFHITNRNVNLGPVITGLARHYQLHQAVINDTVASSHWWLSGSNWVLLSRDRTLLESEAIAPYAEKARPVAARSVEWTDDHASLLEVLN